MDMSQNFEINHLSAFWQLNKTFFDQKSAWKYVSNLLYQTWRKSVYCKCHMAMIFPKTLEVSNVLDISSPKWLTCFPEI